MFSFTTLSLIRMGFSLIMGIIIARWLRNPVRVIVTRSLPMQRRMADDFFQRLTRITTPVGIIIALTAAGLVNWGLIKAGQALRITEHQEITDNEDWPDNSFETPFSTGLDPASLSPAPEQPIARTEVSDTLPIVLPPPIAPQPAEPVRRDQQVGESDVYLQIYAFQNLHYARAQKLIWNGRTPYTCRLAHLPGDKAPYKVLIGPFASRREALAFRRKMGVSGFPRIAGDWMFWEQ